MTKGSWMLTGAISEEIIAADRNREYLTIQLTNSIVTALGIGEAAVAGEGIQLLVAGNSVILVGHQARSAIYAIGNTATGTYQSGELDIHSVKSVLPNLEVQGFAVLGSGAPSIKMKKLAGISAVSGSSVTIAHGLDKVKIIGVQVLITNNSGNRIPPNFTEVGSHKFEFFVDGDNIRIYSVSGNSASIDENAFTVLITYEE